jgi:hypothetical protein
MREWGSLSLIHLVRGAMAQHKSLRNIENGQTIASSDSIVNSTL